MKNTKTLINASKFNINPFLAVYLSNFLTGSSKPIDIARALIYPRVLGTSITTSFGQNIQRFVTDVLSSFGSATKGIDIEFIDQIDGMKKYCQLKAGPNTINKDDVETIAGHFKHVLGIATTNNLRIPHCDLIVGVIYGTKQELSSHYKRIEKQYYHPVIIGQNFWERLTGDSNFYNDLIMAIGEIAIEADFSKELEQVIETLAKSESIISISNNS